MTHKLSDDAILISSSNDRHADLIDDLLETGLFEPSIKDDLSYETQQLLETF